MQQALGTYFHALGVLWDNADLTFGEAEWTSLAARAAPLDSVTAEAIRTLGENLRMASADNPQRWLPRDNSGPRPLREDWRLVNLIAASDGAVQTLLASLARAMTAEAPPSNVAIDAAAAEPALRQLQREATQESDAARAARAAARQVYAHMLPDIGTAHAALKAQGHQITQREVERRIFLADDRLRRAIASLPREAPRETPDAMAAALLR